MENILKGSDGKWKLCDFGSSTNVVYQQINNIVSKFDGQMTWINRRAIWFKKILKRRQHRCTGRQSKLIYTQVFRLMKKLISGPLLVFSTLSCTLNHHLIQARNLPKSMQILEFHWIRNFQRTSWIWWLKCSRETLPKELQ